MTITDDQRLETHVRLRAKLFAQAYSLRTDTWYSDLFRTIRCKSTIFRVLLHINETKERLHEADTHGLTVDKASCYDTLGAYENEMLSLILYIRDEQKGSDKIVPEDTPLESRFSLHRRSIDGANITRDLFLPCSTAEAADPVSSTSAGVGIAYPEPTQAKHKLLEGWT